MEFFKSWVFWIILILLLILIFPKTCGTKNNKENLDYQCKGIKLSFLTRNSNNSYYWCSGFCTTNKKQMINSSLNLNQQNDNEPKVVKGIFQNVAKWLIPIILIFLAFFLLNWLKKLKNKV